MTIDPQTSPPTADPFWLHRAASPQPPGVASWDLSETAAVAICPAAALARAPGCAVPRGEASAARRFACEMLQPAMSGEGTS